MKLKAPLPIWTIIAPLLACLLFFGKPLFDWNGYSFLLALGLIAAVMAAVHHAEVIAHRVGEPFGTLILAVAVTVIEVSLIEKATQKKPIILQEEICREANAIL